MSAREVGGGGGGGGGRGTWARGARGTGRGGLGLAGRPTPPQLQIRGGHSVGPGVHDVTLTVTRRRVAASVTRAPPRQLTKKRGRRGRERPS